MSLAENVFLTADWRDLLMLNYEVEPDLLQEAVPHGTQLDSFDGKTYVSLVGFRFCSTRFRGCFPIPFHSEFEEINLRFYVRRTVGGQIRRGVVFIAEIVPKLAIAKTAHWVYGENYVCRTMSHRVDHGNSNKLIKYSWRAAAGECDLSATFKGDSALPPEGSLQQFITEHYWGYSRRHSSGTLEYHVAHAPWKVWSSSQAEFAGDPSDSYGSELSRVLQRSPDSAFVAEGSTVSVFRGISIF